MTTRRMFILSGALAAIFATAMPFELVVDADGVLRVASSSAFAQKSGAGNSGGGQSGNAGGGGAGGSGRDSGSDNGGAGAGGNGSKSGTDGLGGGSSSTSVEDAGTGEAGGITDGATDSGVSNPKEPGSGIDDGSGADTGTPDKTGTPSAPETSASRPPNPPAAPVAQSEPDVQVDVRGGSITVRHHNGATERISQGRYEMRDSRSRTIVNRKATPSDTSRLWSFDR